MTLDDDVVAPDLEQAARHLLIDQTVVRQKDAQRSQFFSAGAGFD